MVPFLTILCARTFWRRRQISRISIHRPLPGGSFFTSKTQHLPIVEAALERFDGQHWLQIGEVMAGQ